MTNDAKALSAAKEARRDPRLDFFRGLGMFIILIAHIPGNRWNNWIPARFGYSDATEIFVFCSGAASAIAFYKVFEMKGWLIGTARVGFRLWQLYWCHIAIFFAILVALLVVDNWGIDPNRSHVGQLNLSRFLSDPAAFLPGLFGLSYIPNYFDILAMYIVVLALMPIVIWLSTFREDGARPWLAMGFCVALWALVSQPWLSVLDVPVFTGLNLPAEPVGNDRTWFFNPFCWQLIFFTGFAFALGWLPTPPIRWWLILICLAIVIICVPLDPDGNRYLRAWIDETPQLEWVAQTSQLIRDSVGPLQSKTFFGLFRYLHFLALAYVVWALAGEGGRRLPLAGIGGMFVTIVRRVGQQSLAVFIASLLIARLIGVYLSIEDVDGRGSEMAPVMETAIANLVGFALIIAVAYIARYFRNPPWKS